MRGGKYLVLRMKCALSIPGEFAWRRRLPLLPRWEQVTKDLCYVSGSHNWRTSGAVPSAAGVDGQSGRAVSPVCAW